VSNIIRKQLAQTRRERERAAKQRDRATVATLRKQVRAARKLGTLRTRRAMRACRHNKRIVRLQAMEARLQLARDNAAKRTQARQQCDATKDRARSMRASSVARAMAALDAERAHQHFLARDERSRPRLDKAAKRARRADARSESDSEVENSIEAELVPVWRSVKKRITAGARSSRLERFLEWVEEHKADVRRILEADIERDVRYLIEHEHELRERLADGSSYKHMTDAELDAVPF
jgi:hypothetical protein